MAFEETTTNRASNRSAPCLALYSQCKQDCSNYWGSLPKFLWSLPVSSIQAPLKSRFFQEPLKQCLMRLRGLLSEAEKKKPIPFHVNTYGTLQSSASKLKLLVLPRTDVSFLFLYCLLPDHLTCCNIYCFCTAKSAQGVPPPYVGLISPRHARDRFDKKQFYSVKLFMSQQQAIS